MRHGQVVVRFCVNEPTGELSDNNKGIVGKYVKNLVSKQEEANAYVLVCYKFVTDLAVKYFFL